MPPPKPKGRKKLTPLPLPPKQVAVSDPARYRDHISFYAQMEGSGEFIITGDKIEYIHGSGVEPLAAVVNGRVWKDIYSDFPLRNFYDFQRAKVEQKTGRGVISLERNRADIRIYINDSPPGVGEYTMKITFPETTPLPDRPARQKSLYEIFFDRNFFSAGSVRIPSSRNLSRRVRMVSRPAEIPGNAVLMKTLYLPPFTISAELKPHRSNVRFMLCGGEIIFNSETDPRTLLVNIPGILPQKREKAGWLENEEWQKIRIEVKTNSVRIYVNKTLRYLGTGTISAQKEMIGIYSTFDGSVDLKSFFVSDSVSSD